MKNFEQILDLITRIKATSSRNDKEAILAEALEWEDQSTIQSVMVDCHSPQITFGVEDLTTLPEPTISDISDTLTEIRERDLQNYTVKDTANHISELVDVSGGMALLLKQRSSTQDLLKNLATRVLTGNAALQAISNHLHDLNTTDREAEAEVLKLVLSKTLGAGIGASTINKVWKDLIYIHPYMRCGTLNAKSLKDVKFPCYSQEKLDGGYVDIIVDKDSVTYMTRYGNILDLNDEVTDAIFVKTASELNPNGLVIQGEVLVLGEDGEVLPREQSNGYINSDERDTNRIVFGVWDCIPLKDHTAKVSKVLYDNRINALTKLIDAAGKKLFKVETVECHNIEDIIEHFKKKRSEGKEGTIVKNKHLGWKSHTSKDQLKLKVSAVCDLVVVGGKEGKGKYVGKIAVLELESSDGAIKVNVKCKTDAQTNEATKKLQQWVDSEQNFAVIFNDVCENVLIEGFKSLYLPRLETDKLIEKKGRANADSLERVEEILNSFEFSV